MSPSQVIKKTFLIFLLLVLPLQTLAAAERAFVHALGNGSAESHGVTLQHFVEHSNHVPHHHDAAGHDADDDGDDHPPVHADDSPGSIKHVLDFDQHSNFHAVIPTMAELPAFHFISIKPACTVRILQDRPRRSLFRPPRVPA